MAKLTGQTIADSYDQLLIVDAANGISGSLQAIEAGDTGGSASSLKISTSKCEVIPASNSTSLFEVSQADGTAVLSVDTTNARVGIGTAVPSNDLSVHSATGGVLAINREDADNTIGDATSLGQIVFGGDDPTNNTFQQGAAIAALSAEAWGLGACGTDLVFKTVDNTTTTLDIRMTILDSGKVGIGNTAPGSNLEVSAVSADSTIEISSFSATNSHTGILKFTKGSTGTLNTFSDDADNAEALGRIEVWGSRDDGAQVNCANIQFVADLASDSDSVPSAIAFEVSDSDDASNPTERMRINRAGNVGIGTTTPNHYLDIEGTTSINGRVFATALADGNTNSWISRATAHDGSNVNYAQLGCYLNASHVDPTAFIRLDSQDGVVHYLWATDDDDFHSSPTIGHLGTASGTKFADLTSDERLKDISSDAFPYGLDSVNSLTPIQYKWKEKTDKSNRLGFGAQTIQSIIPESVRDTGECLDGYDHVEDEDGVHESIPKGPLEGNTKLIMEYNQLIPVLAKAIQELSAKVEALENA